MNLLTFPRFNHISLLISAVLSLAMLTACGGSGGGSEVNTPPPYDGQLALIPSGSDLVLMGLTPSGNLEELARASLISELADYSTNHVIFGIAKHPTENLVFVTSMNECGAIPLDTDGCWGNARVDRFTYNSNSITYDGLAFIAQGPLRLSTPVFDALTSELTINVRNQSDSDVSINNLTFDFEDIASSFVTNCDSISLSSGQQCNITITAPNDGGGQGEITIATPDYEFATRVEYDGTYLIEGSDYDNILAGLPECAVEDFNEPYQLGGCAFTALAISDDGSRIYVNEDDYDVALVFSLDPAGNMSLLSEGASVELQGIAVNADNTAMYNGSSAYSIENDIVTEESISVGGNATEVTTTLGGNTLLISTIDNDSLDIYELDTDPLLPTLIDSIAPSSGRAVFQDHSANLETFVVTGRSQLSTFTFDGSSLTESDNIDTSINFDPCVDCEYQVNTRGVQVTEDGLFAVTSTFVNSYDELTLNTVPYSGSATSYSIDPITGALTEIDILTFNGMSRAILFVESP